jgi:hypothetical protein
VAFLQWAQILLFVWYFCYFVSRAVAVGLLIADRRYTLFFFILQMVAIPADYRKIFKTTERLQNLCLLIIYWFTGLYISLDLRKDGINNGLYWIIKFVEHSLLISFFSSPIYIFHLWSRNTVLIVNYVFFGISFIFMVYYVVYLYYKTRN